MRAVGYFRENASTTGETIGRQNRRFLDFCEAQGYEVTGETGPQLMPDIKAQTMRWARIVRAAGFSADDRGSTR